MACCIVLTRWYILRLWMSNTIVIFLPLSLYYPPFKYAWRTPRTQQKQRVLEIYSKHPILLWARYCGPDFSKKFSPTSLPTISNNSDTKRLWLTIWKQFSGRRIKQIFLNMSDYIHNTEFTLTICLKICITIQMKNKSGHTNHISITSCTVDFDFCLTAVWIPIHLFQLFIIMSSSLGESLVSRAGQDPSLQLIWLLESIDLWSWKDLCQNSSSHFLSDIDKRKKKLKSNSFIQ